ncbi:MAG: methyltransferase domain-containing protein [Salibacteraceae bacterium]
MNSQLNSDYWNQRWTEGKTGWDIGSPSTPLIEYFDQLKDKNLRILIPGAGNAWEAEYLHNKGFRQVYVVDIADEAISRFSQRVPSFNKDHIIKADFFELEGQYDLIVEQTFFCAITPAERRKYVLKAWSLLDENGKIVGVLFNDQFSHDGPPFGGTKEEYMTYFQPWFRARYFETAYNSIKPRAGRELFINLIKR